MTAYFEEWVKERQEECCRISQGRHLADSTVYEILQAARRDEPTPALAPLLIELLNVLDRVTRGCKVCRRLPNACGFVSNEIVGGAVCQDCDERIAWRVRDKEEQRARKDEERQQKLDADLRYAEMLEKSSQRNGKPSAVYVMSCDDLAVVKVGRSVNPERRRIALEGPMGMSLRLVHARWFPNVPASIAAEQSCHLTLASRHRSARELGYGWFQATPADAIAVVEEAA